MTDPETPPASGPDTSVALMNDEGNFVENWANNLGDDFKEAAPTLNRYKSPKELGKAHMELRRKSSMDPHRIVEIPDDNSSDEVRAAFNKAAGKPDTVDGYEYELPDELKDKLELDPERFGKTKQFILDELGLSPAKFKKAMDFINYGTVALDEASKVLKEEKRAQAIDEGNKELTKLWGDGKDDRITRANAVLRKYGGADAVEEFNAENSPKMAKFLDNIASVMSEAKIKGLGSITAPTTEAIDREIAELRNKPAYTDRSDPDHKRISERVTQLYLQKSPE